MLYEIKWDSPSVLEEEVNSYSMLNQAYVKYEALKIDCLVEDIGGAYTANLILRQNDEEYMRMMVGGADKIASMFPTEHSALNEAEHSILHMARMSKIKLKSYRSDDSV